MVSFVSISWNFTQTWWTKLQSTHFFEFSSRFFFSFSLFILKNWIKIEPLVIFEGFYVPSLHLALKVSHKECTFSYFYMQKKLHPFILPMQQQKNKREENSQLSNNEKSVPTMSWIIYITHKAGVIYVDLNYNLKINFFHFILTHSVSSLSWQWKYTLLSLFVKELKLDLGFK